MKKSHIREIIESNIGDKRLFKYTRKKCDYYYRFSVLLSSSKDLILGAVEDDFMLNGFRVIRFKDISDMELKGDLYEEIINKEGLLNKIEVPQIRLDNWQTVFEDLKTLGEYIIIEHESLDEDEWEFGIGRISRIYKGSVHLEHFDADGVWQESPFIIPYSTITTVTFGSRYLNVFSKYV